VLGIDPGLSRCGWAVLEQPGGLVVALGYGTVVTRGEDVPARLWALAGRLREVIAEHRPEQMAIERLFVNANVRTAMTVGQASGVALLLAAEHGMPLSTYTPSQVKQAVTGSGTAPKEQVGYMVRAILRLAAIPRPADTADAIAVALCHLHHLGTAAAFGSGQATGTAAQVEGGRGSGGLGAASAADWLARAAPTSPGLRRRDLGNPEGVPQ
jgi:crossover junction endodeoxyribonuclease RuvC